MVVLGWLRNRVSLTLLVLVILVSTSAQAQIHLDLDTQPLSVSLSIVGNLANINVLFTPESVDNLRAPSIKADLSVEDALARLIAGTNLRIFWVNRTTISIVSEAEAKRLEAARARQNGAASDSRSTRVYTSLKPEERDDLAEIRSDETNARDTEYDSTQQRDGTHVSSTNKHMPGEGSEVVVTASKRSETLSKAPLAISALDMNQLEEAGVVALKDLTSAVPDVQIHTIGLDSFVGINIRGISNYDYSGTADPAVSTYIDGAYIGLSQGFASELYDIERVEVLRGPQGTLYGRNATGGNLNVITADPKGEFSSAAGVSYGNYNDLQTNGMINIPVADQFYIRGAFMTRRNDGYFNTEGTTARRYGASDDFGGRITALWTPSNIFRWRLSFDEFISQGTPWASVNTGPDGNPLNNLPVYHQPTSSDPEPQNYIKSLSVRSRMDWTISTSTVASYIAGYQNLDTHYAWATTGELSAPINLGWVEYLRANGTTSQSHELNLNSDIGAIKNVFGGSYYRQSGPTEVGYGAAYAYGLYYSGAEQNPGDKKEAWGIFDQATYSIVDRLRVTAGIRYSKEKQFLNEFDQFYCGIPQPALTLREIGALTPSCLGYIPASTPAGSGSWSNVNWKAGLEGDVNDSTLAYFSVTTGFKAGGVQVPVAPGFPASYSPEKVTSYEFGLKSRLPENAVSFRGAAFYADYTDLQVSQLLAEGGSVQLTTTNAGKAKIYGLELESEWRPSPSDHIAGFINYLHATYTNYDNAQDPITGFTNSLSGNQLPNAPQESFRLQYSHDFRLPNGGTLTPLAAIYWQSFSYLSPFEDSDYRVGAYSKTDVSLSYTDASERWAMTAFAENLEDKAVRTGQFTGGGGPYSGAGVYSDFAPPRIFGIRISYRQR